MGTATATRMSTDARREQLLSAGADLLANRGHDEVSIEEIAEAAGVSKGLLYHYFPTKKAFILAALSRGEEQLAERLRPDPSLGPEAQLLESLSAFLDDVERHPSAYTSIFRRGGSGDPEIAAALDTAREARMESLMAGLAAWDGAPFSTERTAALETAVRGWVFFVEGAVLHWLENGGLDRDRLLAMLQIALGGALWAADKSG